MNRRNGIEDYYAAVNAYTLAERALYAMACPWTALPAKETT